MTKAHTDQRAKIEPQREYNIKAMIDANGFPWITGGERQKYRKYVTIIKADLEGANVLMASRIPQGQKGKYLVKGRAIIRFIKVYGPGLQLEKNNAYGKRDERKHRSRGARQRTG